MERNTKLYVAGSSPHFRSDRSVRMIMLDVIIALLPAAAAAVYFFGLRAALVIAVCTAASVLAELAFNKIMKKPVSIGDLSAVVTGILLAFNLPPSIPLWIAAIGSVFAIVVVKMIFGGLGMNFINPALAARAFLMASWPVAMTTWTSPFIDAATSATPLAILKGGEAVGAAVPDLSALFLGSVAGSLGETSALAILLGGAYLAARRVISLDTPLAFIGTTALVTWILGGTGFFTGNVLYHLFAGGLMLGAFFMATDYPTSPITTRGKILFGAGCGLLTAIIRLYGGYPEGVCYSILIMNLTVPLIDKYLVPKSFGGE